jgi:hypothetical protein
MKSLSFLILVVGIVFTTIGYMEMKMENNNKKLIEYRFIPRNVYDEQFNPQNLKQSFSDMFEKLEPSSYNI